MERSKEESLLRAALESNRSQDDVTQLCRMILKERISDIGFYDSILQEKLMEIMSVICFPLKFAMKEQHFSGEFNKKRHNSSALIMWVVLGFLGLALSVFSIGFVSLLGGILLCTTGFGLKSALSPKQEQPVTSLVCASTVPELMAEIDVLYKKVLALLNHNQLEGRNKRVLLWLQRLYSDPDDDKFKREILKLVTALGYEFVEYDKAYSENFEVSDANVSEVMTTEYALRNKATGVFVLPGVVVFPKSEDK